MDESLEQIVDVVAAEVRVTVGRENLEDVAIGCGNELEDGDVKGAATEIVDGDLAALLFVEAVGERRGSGLVDEAKNFEPGDFAGVLGGLALGIVEIGGDGDDGAIDSFAEMGFGPVFQLTEDEGRNFGRSENFVAEHDADDILACRINAERKELELVLNVGRAAAHQPLDGIDSAFGLREEPSASRLAHNDGSVRIQANYRRTERAAVRSLDTLRLACLRVGVSDETVCCSEIDSDDSAHDEQGGVKAPRPYKSSF